MRTVLNILIRLNKVRGVKMWKSLMMLVLLVSITLVPSYAIPGGQEVINDGGGSGSTIVESEDEELTYAEYNQIKKKQAELEYKKAARLPSVINVTMIVIGSLIIIFGMLLVLAYWFDIFNTFTSLSIIYLISAGRMYPVAKEDEIIAFDYKGAKLVTFKGILKRFFGLLVFGILIMETNRVWSVLVGLYYWLSNLMG